MGSANQASALVRRAAAAAALIAGLALARPAAGAQEQPLVLAEGGRALLPVVIAASAPASTRQVAAELAGYLGRISGAAFQVESGAGGRGIILGTLAEFPSPAWNARWPRARAAMDARPTASAPRPQRCC